MTTPSAPDKTTQEVIPWQGVQPFLLEGYQNLNQLYKTQPQYYPDSTIAPQSSLTSKAIQETSGTAKDQRNLAADITGRIPQTYDILTQEDPYLAAAVEGAINPIQQRLTDVILPGIQDQFVMNGGIGGTRQGVAQATAINDFTRNALDTSSKMYADAYQQKLGNLTDLTGRLALGLPSIQAGVSAPQDTLYQGGGADYAYNQALLDDMVNRWNYEQNIPYDQIERYLNTLLGVPMGSETTASPTSTNPLLSAGGMGLLGWAATSNPYVAGGAALLGLLS